VTASPVGAGAVEAGRVEPGPVDPGPVAPTTFPARPRGWAEELGGPRPGDEVGDGPFGRAVTAFVWGAGLTALLTVANLPLVLLALLLRPDPSLAWLVVLAAVPAGPALSAGLYAVREHYVDPDVPVARAFLRGYRLGWRDAAAVSVPVCVLVGVVALVAAAGRDAGVPPVAAGLAPGAGVLLVVLALHALALRTFFHLSLADAVQAAAFYVVARWRTSLGTLVLVVGAVAVATATSDLLLALLAGVWVWLWYRTAAPMLRDAAGRFLADRPATPRPPDPLGPHHD
jgi:uncharacterized membrane protein YesL